MTKFEQNLSKLFGCLVSIQESGIYPTDEPGEASVAIAFSNGAKLRADYWRLLGKRSRLSSFDHHHKYGLPAPIDAIAELQNALGNSKIVGANLDAETADLLFIFDNGCKLQVLTVTGYEIWEIAFPDGTREHSNHAERNFETKH